MVSLVVALVPAGNTPWMCSSMLGLITVGWRVGGLTVDNGRVPACKQYAGVDGICSNNYKSLVTQSTGGCL